MLDYLCLFISRLITLTKVYIIQPFELGLEKLEQPIRKAGKLKILRAI